MPEESILALVAKNIAVEMHRHHAVQLVISLDKTYNATLGDQAVQSIRGFLIDSDIPHACQSANSTVLVISVDSDSTKGRMLKQQLSQRTFVLLDEILSVELINHFLASYWSYVNDTKNEFDYLYLIDQLSDSSNKTVILDERSFAAIDYINQHISRTIRVTDIAQYVGLSESRLRHLFTSQIGIPLTAYILWVRIKVALRGMLKLNMNLSDAAHQAGFSDQAHFTRTFKRMFGVAPSLLLKYGQFLKIFDL